jgi:hypothetical protein
MYCLAGENSSILDDWRFVISDGLEPDFAVPVGPTDMSNLVIKKLLTTRRLMEFYPILTRFSHSILSQLRSVPDLTQLLGSAIYGVGQLQRDHSAKPSFEPCFDGYKVFLEDLVRLCSSAGHCPSASLIPQLYRRDGLAPTTDFARGLFDIAYRLDFSAENKKNHAKCVSEMALQTIENYNANSTQHLVALLRLWIDYCAFENRHQTLIDPVSTILGIIMQKNVATLFEADLDVVTQKLVRSGARILDSIDVAVLDPEAFQIYRDAVNNTIKK